ncbi:uncharacterized protein LOC129751959 [Uranotaenia lowii]|uniref:uncharacterized protein LOC129751959 n=1 Tax=Uranotaenia lowii TaxID=190385 RepID=UPI0024786CB3|nr:uncharacterized protein LOC129751959 [Uranotaenia lowii]
MQLSTHHQLKIGSIPEEAGGLHRSFHELIFINAVDLEVEFPDLAYRQLGNFLKIHHSTVSRVLKRFQKRLTLEHGKGAGRKPGPENKKTEEKVKRMFKANPNV